MRLFFALSLPPQARSALYTVALAVRANASVNFRARIEPDALHVTLKFLGRCEPNLLPLLERILTNATNDCAPVEVRITKLGAFGSARRGQVVFAAVEEHGQGMKRLAERLDLALEPLGIARESRVFNPHVTLARTKPGSVPVSLGELSPITCDLDRVGLFESELGRSGARYKLLSERVLTSESSR